MIDTWTSVIETSISMIDTWTSVIETSISCMETSMRLYRHEFCPLWRSIGEAQGPGLVSTACACANLSSQGSDDLAYNKLFWRQDLVTRPIRFEIWIYCLAHGARHGSTSMEPAIAQLHATLYWRRAHNAIGLALFAVIPVTFLYNCIPTEQPARMRMQWITANKKDHQNQCTTFKNPSKIE